MYNINLWITPPLSTYLYYLQDWVYPVLLGMLTRQTSWIASSPTFSFSVRSLPLFAIANQITHQNFSRQTMRCKKAICSLRDNKKYPCLGSSENCWQVSQNRAARKDYMQISRKLQQAYHAFQRISLLGSKIVIFFFNIQTEFLNR